MHNFYLLHIYTMSLLHVSVCLTPSSGRTYVFLTQKHLLLRSYYVWYSGCVIKYKRYNRVGLQHFLQWLKSYDLCCFTIIFTMVEIMILTIVKITVNQHSCIF